MLCFLDYCQTHRENVSATRKPLRLFGSPLCPQGPELCLTQCTGSIATCGMNGREEPGTTTNRLPLPADASRRHSVCAQSAASAFHGTCLGVTVSSLHAARSPLSRLLSELVYGHPWFSSLSPSGGHLDCFLFCFPNDGARIKHIQAVCTWVNTCGE